MLNKSFVGLFIAVIFLVSCNSGARKIKGGDAVYGDTLVLSIPESVDNYFPLANSEFNAHVVLSQIFEPLFTLSNDSIKSHLVETYQWSEDRKELTLNLRENIYFHDDPCFKTNSNELTAYDVKHTIEMACKKDPLNQSSDALRTKIKGAEEFYMRSNQGKSADLQGVKIINDHQLKIFLNNPYSSLLKILSSSKYSVFSKVAYDFYKENIVNHPIGTGPFCLTKKTNANIVLRCNKNYWKKDKFGNLLPYLNALVFNIIEDKREEFRRFQLKKTHLIINASAQYLNDILGDLPSAQKGATLPHKVIVIPGSSVSMFVFNPAVECFKDARVRKAFDLVLDRKVICDDLLNGDGFPAFKGFAPTSPFYNNSILADKNLNITEAKVLMASAGFTNNHPFPEVNIYVSSEPNSKTEAYCLLYAKSLKTHLNIDAKVVRCSSKLRNSAIRDKKASIWKIGWAPEYPDPEGYFSLFYSKNNNLGLTSLLIPNIQSNVYDFNYELGEKEIDAQIRNNYFTNCDAILQEEVNCMPIMYEDFVMVINLEFRNIKVNAMGIFDLTNCYFKRL